MMQGVRRYGSLSDGGVRLELTPTTNSPLAIDVSESTEMRIQRLISENPVIIFSRSSCCMCHVMKRLLSTIGVHPTVIELEEDEIGALAPPPHDGGESGGASGGGAPVVFIGGTRVGGLESLVALHLSNHLVPKLVEVGALSDHMRYEIVNGVDEVGGVSSGSTVDQETDQSTGEKGVPHFWLTALKNNEVLSEEITERDEDALQYLRDIKWSKLDGSKGFKLDFFFDPNPYFKNAVLTKAYSMISDDEHILEKATGTEIEWLPGKNLTQKILKKKSKKVSEDTKPITRTEDCVSFFNFFKPPQVPEDDDEIDEETAELLQSQMEHDYNIGSTIREKIIPHAVSWYTGEAAEVDEEETEDEDNDEEDDDDDVEESDEEDDNENEVEDKEEDEKSRKKGDESTDNTRTVAV